MMRLRGDLDRRFKQDLVAYEEELHMPYVTSIERLAKKEGREEGLLDGRKSLLLHLLTRVCGPLPEDLTDKIHQLSLEQCEGLGEALLEFESLTDLRNWFQESAD